MDSLTIRQAAQEDLTIIQEIEKVSFPSPWSTDIFQTTLSDQRCRNIVICSNGEVVGYCFAFMMKTMLHMLNLAVHPGHRKKGVAKRLLNEIISGARTCDKEYVFLEVRKSNEQARLLYESIGFSRVSTWPKYYTDTREDADVMVKRVKGKQYERH